MTRAAVAVAGALLLAGCPIPQPLPDYPPGTITPPRILTESLTIQDPVVFVPAGCSSTEPGPAYVLGARLFDTNNIEQVEARWFVNYPDSGDPYLDEPVPPDTDPTVFERAVAPFVFHPYAFPPPRTAPTGGRYTQPGTIRVVELLVSNAFFNPAVDAPIPFRSPAPNFETQLQRWTFQLEASAPDAPGCP